MQCPDDFTVSCANYPTWTLIRSGLEIAELWKKYTDQQYVWSFIYFFLSILTPSPTPKKIKQCSMGEHVERHKNFCHAQSVQLETGNNYTLDCCPHSILAPICAHQNPRPPTWKRKEGATVSQKLPVRSNSRAFYFDSKSNQTGLTGKK